MEFKAGQKVRIRGDRHDYTDGLDGEIGIIIEVNEADVRAVFKHEVSTFDWCIWKNNIIEIVEDV